MRTYKEPKRIDKARSREPGLVTLDERISKMSALSVQVEEETMENSSDKEEEMIEDNDSGVQENHIDDEELELDNEKMEENKNDKDENHEKMEDDNVEISVKKKTPPKKTKKVVENNVNHNEDINDIKKCEPEGEKRKQEPSSKTKKTTNVKDAKKRKMSDKKNDKSQGSKDVHNNCVVDLGSKEKISPKSKSRSRSTKSKQKSNTTDDTDADELHKEESEKSSSFNTSDSLNVSPRSSKRTPVKNRKYQSDEEHDPSKEEGDSSGKKKRSRSKSPRCSTPKKRKLNFDENEFMNIKDDDFVIEKNDKDIEHVESVTNESNDNNKSKKVVKSRKNKSLIKEDIILKPKAIKKKAKLSHSEIKPSSQSEIKPSIDDTSDKNESVEKVKDESLTMEESSELKENAVVKVKKKKIRKKKPVENQEKNDSAEIKSDKIEVKSESADTVKDNNKDDTKTENENDIENNSEKPNSNNQGDNEGKSEKPIDTEKGEKKEKRKMKPLEEIVCTYCKKVSVGKAANTRHLKKCFVYQAKLVMDGQDENTELETTDETKKDEESHVECKDEDKTCVYSETINESNIECDDVSKENLNQSENQSEDKENLNDSVSSENKSIENQSSSKKRSKTDSVYNCQHCDYTAHKRAMLAKHLHSHNIFMCLRCSFFCESDDELKDHMHREHKERMDHKLCRKCSRYVHCAEITLEQHMESCQGPVPFKCPHCEKEFKYESSLKSHILKHDPDGPKKFSCPQCSYKSNYKANLKKHLVNIHSSRIKQFKCTYEDCEKMFHSEDNMRRHLKWHSIDKPFKCKQCHKEFRTSGALSGHCVVHKTGTPFKCTVEDCEKSFRSHKLLKNHLQDFHHQAEKKFICAHSGCDFSFFKRSHLDRHLVTHSGERKYGCSYCGKAFRHADNLRVHLRQHTNEKPVSCNMCDFKCRQKSSLRYHLQKIHNIVFKKREKRKEKSASGDGVIKSENDITVNSLDSSLDLITAIVNAVAKSEDIETPNDTVNDKSNSAKTSTGNKIKDDAKPDSPVANKVVDLYEFKSDDEFGDESVMVPLPLPVQRPINHLNKSNEKVDNKVKVDKKVKVEAKIENEDEPTDTEYPDNKDSIEKIVTPKPKVVRRGKKKKINYAEPETDLSFETVDAKDMKEENVKKEEKEENVVKRKRGPKKSKLKVEKAVEEKKEEDDEKSEVTPKGRRGRKKVEKIPKKRGRKPKSVTLEEKSKKPVVKSPINKIKKKAGRPRKVRPPSESEEEDKKKDETKDDESNHDENDSEKEEDETIPRENEEDDDTVDVPLLSTPNPDEDDDDTREYIGDENLKENAHLVSNLENKQSEKEDKDEEEEIETKSEVKTEVKIEAKVDEKIEAKIEPKTEEKTEEKKEPQIENESVVVEKQGEQESDKMSSGIDTDFEDDIKPPPAPRPPPVVDSDEGDIESGPDEMDTPGRDFESTPPKSNITEHIHSVPAHTPRDFESSPPKSVQTIDYGPSTLSQTGFENRREGDSVEALSGSYTATPSREVSVEEKRDEREASLPYSNLESENLPNTQSPIMEPIPPEPQSNANPDYGSQSESTMPEVDKEYLGQYLQQFDSASRSEDDRIERINSQNEQTSEPIEIPSSPQKDLPPLNLSANAPPLNLSTNSNDRENSQGSDMSNKRMEILSIDRQTEDHYSSRSENVSRSSDRIPDNVYESISSMNTFMPPTTREAPIIHSAESPFPSVSTPSTFMRFSENDAILQRQRMSTPFLSQGDPNALQNLHRMADNALAQHNNASLLRRPTTVPPREDMFSSSTAAMATMARNPFHNTWASQEVRPAHWSQSPYLGRTIDRPTAAPTASIFGKDNYLPGREFMFEQSRRAVADRNVFPGLPQAQRPELAHDTFPMDRFDIGSYFSGHTYPGASTLTEYNRAAAAHTSQKTFDERYRQSSTGITDFRALPQTTASSMFSSNMLNSSFHLDKYMYSRDPVYHAQHIPDATNSPFLPPGVPGQHSVFDREYTRGYFQNSPYSLDKQYAAAAAASAKLTHPSGASVVQERDFVPRPGTAAATGENQEAYRHPMLYNMMNHRFYE